ncbi:MAG: hypothetical protein ACYC5O_03060 [Anaerolineae bacterium]
MASDRGSRVYSYGPSAPPPPTDAGTRRSPLGIGCLGIVLGLLLGACALGGIAAAAATAAPESTVASAAGTDADMIIIVQESYFNDLVTQAMPEDWTGDLQMDVQPGNRVAIGGRVKTTIFGQTIEGDVTGTVGINAENGLLVLNLEDVQAFGFSLGSLGAAFTDTLWQDVGDMVNRQVKDGLGENAEIASVSTDDTSLTVQARLP